MTIDVIELILAAAAILVAAAVGTVSLVGLLVWLAGWRRLY